MRATLTTVSVAALLAAGAGSAAARPADVPIPRSDAAASRADGRADRPHRRRPARAGDAQPGPPQPHRDVAPSASPHRPRSCT